MNGVWLFLKFMVMALAVWAAVCVLLVLFMIHVLPK